MLLLFVIVNLANATNFTYLYNDSNSGYYSLESGTFVNSGYSSTLLALALNGSNTTGSHLSPVIDAGANANWKNISWFSHYAYDSELPNFGGVDNWVNSSANMTGNVLLYHFNNDSSIGENSTLFVDQSGANLNATCTTACPVLNTTWHKYTAGSSLYFAGANYITLGDTLENVVNSSNGFTFSAWIYPAAATGYMLTKYNTGKTQWIFRYSSTRKWDILMYTSTDGTTLREYTATNAVDLNAWYHVVFVVNVISDTYAIYVNGTEVAGSKTGTSSAAGIRNTTEPVSIGRTNNGAYFRGNLDEMAIWNRTFSAGEVSELYARSASRFNVSIKTCAVSDCSDQQTFPFSINSPQNTSFLAPQRYLQYNISMESDVAGQTPEILNLTLYSNTNPITINAPIHSFNTSNSNIVLNFSPGLANVVDSCWYSVNNTVNVSIPGCLNATTNQTTIPVGVGLNQNVTVYVNDTSGNLERLTRFFNVNYNFTYLYNGSNSGIYTLESGVISNALYNVTSGYFALTGGNTAGAYVSPVIDAGSNSTWTNISWNVKYAYINELPNFGGNDSNVLTSANMTGNVLLYHFNNNATIGETFTSFVDQSGSWINGTCATKCPAINTSTTLFNTGSSVSFNGTTYINIGDSLEDVMNGSNGATISMWVYPGSSAANAMLLAKYDSVQGNRQWFFRYKSTKAFDLTVYGALSGTSFRQYVTTSTFNVGQWYHVVYVINRVTDSYKIYVNGEEAAGTLSGTALTNIPNSAEPVIIAGAQDGAAGLFTGNLDEFAIWNRTLSATEINDIFKRSVSRYNVSVKTCANNDCSDQPNFAAVYNSTPQILSLNSQRYFQYNISMITNAAGNSSEIYNVTLYSTGIGGSAPEITINAPTNNTNQSSTSLTLNFSATTSDVLNTCWYAINSTTNVTIPGCVNATTNQTIITVNSGLNQNITVYANDSLGYIGSLTRLFNVDVDTPIIAVTTPVNNTYSPSNQMLVNVTTSDLTLQSCWYSINGGANVSYTCNATAFNVTLTNGVSTIYFFANDSFGQNASTGLYNYNYSNLLSLTGVLNTTTVPTSAWVNITGVLKLANGSTIPSNNVSIFVDDAPATLITTGWWNNGWNYRKLINITENSGANLTDFQYNFSFDTRVLISQGYMQSNCSDIRFTDENANPLSYFIESGCNTTTTNIWVKSNLTASTTNTIYIYYGNPSATTGSDPDGTFILYDDFNGSSINLTKWSVYSGLTYTVSNGIYQVTDVTTGWLAANGLNASTSNYQGVYFEFRNLNWSHVASDLFQWELALYNSSGGYYTMGIGIQDSHTGTSEGYLYSHIGNSATLGVIDYDNSLVSLIGTRAENGAVTYYVNGTSKRTGNTNATFDKIILVASKNSAGPYPTTDAGLVWVRTFSSSMPSLSFNSSQESNVSSTNVIQTNSNGVYSVILVAPNSSGVKNISITSSFANAMGNTSSNLTVTGAANSAPTHGTPTLNSTDNSNTTSQNLTVYNVSTSDANADAVKNIINWYLNDTSITTLNWAFDGGSNSTFTKDYSNNNYSGDVNGAQYISSAGRDGFGAYNFTNSSTYVATPSLGVSSLLKDNFTITFWANPGAVADKPNFGFSGSGGYNSENPFASYDSALTVGNGAVAQTFTALPDAGANTWTHYAIVDNGTHYSVYVNGTLSASAAITVNPSYGSNRTFILGNSGFDSPYDNPYVGLMDDFVIYSKALSPAQINSIYNNRSDLIVSAELANSQSWRACITPNDGSADGVEKCSNSLVTLSVPDVTAPVVSISLPVNNTNQSNTTLNLTFTATDAQSSLSTCWYSINGTNNVTIPGCISASPNTTALTVSAGNNQNVTVYANDTSGNVGSAISYFNINEVPTHATPILNATTNTNLTTQNITVYNVSTSDTNGDSVKNIVTWYVNGTSFENIIMPFDGDSNNATFAKDYSGFASNGTVNGGAAWSSTSGFDGKGAYTFDGVDDYISIPNNSATDIRGNLTISLWTKSNVATNQYDTILMKTTSTSWNDGYGMFYNSNNEVRFFVGVYSLNAAVATITPTVWNHIVGTYDGSTVRIYVNGVEGTSDSYSGAIPETSAALELSRGASNLYNINGIIDELRIYDEALSASEVLALYQNQSSTITNVHLTAGSSWQACITPNDGVADGTTKCSNNLTILSSAPADVTAPVITINSPTNNTNQSSTTLTLNFSATDASSFTCWYSINGTTNVTVAGCVNATTNQTSVSVSNSLNQNLTVWVNDSSGNIASATRTFNIDATAPLLSLVLPANNTNQTSTTLSINISASDAGLGLSTCWYSINGTANVTFTCANNATAAVTNGNNQNVTVYVNDSVGNLNASTNYFNIDSVSPTITINAPDNNTNQSSTTLTINFSASDSNPISSCWYDLNNTQNLTIAGCVNGITNQTSVTVTNGLNQNVTIYANDSFGNTASTTRVFSVDNSAPTITVNVPVNNSNLSSSTLTINFSAIDQLPLGACWYTINGTNNVTIVGCANSTTNQTTATVTTGNDQNITVYVNDSVGNLASATRTFNYVTVNPVITINSPVNNSNQTSTNLVLNFSVYAGAALDTCKYSINGAANVTVDGCINSTTNQTTIIVSNGLNQNITLYVNDTNGNAVTSMAYFGVDSIAPSLTLHLPVNNTNQSSTTLAVNITTSDSGIGLSTCWYSVNDTANVTFTCANNATATVTNGLNQNITVYVNDSLGNLNSTTRTFNIDSSTPVITINLPVNNTNQSSTTLTLNFSATDTSPLSTCWYSINSTTNVSIAGCVNNTSNQTTISVSNSLNQNVTVYVNDSLGNIASLTRTFNINSNAPVITINSPTNSTNQSSTTLTINFSALTSGTLDTCLYSINGTTNVTIAGCASGLTNQTTTTVTVGDNQNITIYVNDTLGNAASATRTFSIDTTTPEITVNSPVNNSNLSSSTLTINFSATDAHELNSCWYSVNATTNVTITGCVNAATNQTTATIAPGLNQNITIYVNDTVGNIASVTRTFNYVTSAPVVTINSPVNNANQTSTTLTLNFSATAQTTISSCWYSINGTTNVTVPGCVNATTNQTVVTVTNELSQNVTVYVNDSLGNTGSATSYFNIDNTAPTITVNLPVNNTNQSSTTLTLNFSATDASALSTCWYNVNSTTNVTIPGCVNATTNQTTITVTNGLNQNITLYVNDSLGNLGSTTRTFNINSNAPVITVNSPANNTNQSSTTLTINFSAATSAILDTCYYSINSTSNVTVNGCINATTNQTSISLTAGLNQNVTIYANDTLGNLGSATRTFSIDSVAPVITFNTPTNNSNLSSSTLTINFSAVDQLPLSSCWYSINGTSNVTIAGCVNATTNQTTATIATGSAQNITVYVNDSVGNLASATRTFNYNTNAPTVTINAPTNYQNQSSTSLVLNFSATTTNTLDSCWYTINNTVNNSIACVNATTAQTTVTVVEGLNQNVTVYANDTLGNTATAIAYFTVDQTAPSISVNAPEYNANLTSTPMTINFSATDALTLSTCWYSINGTANVTVPGCLNAVTNQTTATITVGLNQNVTIYANDTLGNIANILIPFNYVQSSSINLTINTPTDNQNQANTTLEVNFTLASASSISSCWYNLNNTSNVTINPCVNNADNLLSITASNGLNQNITVYVNDSTGNLTSATKAFHIDSIAPTVTINLPANNTNYASTNLTVNFTATDTTSINSCWYDVNSTTNVTVPGCASGVSNQFQINASLATGQNITVYANDSFGNLASTIHYFGIDLSATVLTINLPVNNTNQSSDALLLNFSAQNNYGISNCWYSINATTNVTVNGCVNATTNQTTITVSNSTAQTITIYANDTFGNETSTTRTFNIDPTTPNITINTPTNNTNISTSTLTLNFTPLDNYAINTCWYSVNNTVNTTITCANAASSQTSVTITPGLNQNITVYVNDSAGNQNHSTIHFNYTESNLNITINSPANNTNQTTNEITLNFTPTSTLDISTCMYSINNTANVTVLGCENGQSNETNLTLAEGANQNVTIYVNDTNGNWASTTRYFTIDSTAPSLNIYAPANASTTTDATISITYSATDTGIGVQNCYYSLDTAPNVTISNCQNTTITPSLGTHNLTVYANDSLGNLNQSQLITFTLTQAPAPSSGGGGGSGGGSGGSGGSSAGSSNNTNPNEPTMGSSSANTITTPDARHAILVNEEYIVNTTFNPDSTVLSIEFKPKEDSIGTLVLLLPLSFVDYQSGRITITPLPTRVESSLNGIKAYYENVTVLADLGFKAQVVVKSALSKGVINEFKITFINANISREFSLEDNPITQNYVPITIVILAIVLGAVYWFMLKKKNKKEEGKTISS